MSLPDAIPLSGCRHDVLGHALKAIGVLRALATCAAADDRDFAAEGWWDSATATFKVRSTRYPDADSLAKFFAEKYRPTPIIAAWNKSGGVTDKIEVTISCNVEATTQFRKDHESVLEGYGLKKEKQVSEAGTLVFKLSDPGQFGALESLAKQLSLTCTSRSKKQGQKTHTEVTIAPELGPLNSFLESQRNRLVELGLGATKELSAAGQLKFASDSGNQAAIEQLAATFNDAACPSTQTGSSLGPECNNRPLTVVCEAKESGKKDGTLPNASRLLTDHSIFQECLAHARRFVACLQETDDSDEDVSDVFLRYRDQLPDAIVEALDSLCTLHLTRDNDNPLFIRRGRPGDKVNADIFLNFWDYFIAYRKNPEALARASLFCERVVGSGSAPTEQKGKGTPGPTHQSSRRLLPMS